MANLFNKAKTTAPKTAAKKDEKVRVNLNDPDFFTKVYKLEILQDRMKSDKAQADMLAQSQQEQAAQQQQILRQQKMAEMLLQQGLQQPQGQMISGHYVAPSFTQNLAGLANVYMGQRGIEKADKAQIDLANKIRQQGVQESQDIISLMRGREARPEVVPQGQTLRDDQGVLTMGSQRGVAGVAPDLEAAYARSAGASSAQGRALAPLLAKQLMPDLTPEEKRYKAAVADGSWKPEKMGGFNSFLNQLTEKDKANLAIERAKLADQGIFVGGGAPSGVMPSSGVSMAGSQGGGQQVTGDAKYMPANLPTYEYNRNLSPAQNRELAGKFETDLQKNVKNAKSAFNAIKDVSEILGSNAPSSGRGENIITGVREFFGRGGEASKTDAQLKVLEQQLVQQVPRFEGPQSDKDVASYKAAAGDVGNPNIPIASRMGALQVLIDLNKKYYPNGDWDSINLNPPNIKPNILGGTNTYFGATVQPRQESGWRVK
jgi:hypothetical protein